MVFEKTLMLLLSDKFTQSLVTCINLTWCHSDNMYSQRHCLSPLDPEPVTKPYGFERKC